MPADRALDPVAGQVRSRGPRFRSVVLAALPLALLRLGLPDAAGQDAVAEVREHLATGRYAECIEAASAAMEDMVVDEDFHILKLRAQLAVGEVQGAVDTVQAALDDNPMSIRLRWLGRPAFLASGQIDRAQALLAEIEDLIRRAPWRYRNPQDRVVVGRFLLSRGADARQVLEAVYDPVKKSHPHLLDPYLASGDLALEKQDFRVASEEFERAAEIAPRDPDVLFRLSRAVAADDPERAQTHLRAALERNPNHIDSILYLVDGAIDREEYDKAATLIARVLAVDAAHPEALAYRAVLAHLAGDYEEEKAVRAKALKGWSANPRVDHVIGRKLSQKYRFDEGAEYQRRALAFDGDYLPAKIGLCQDLLRLGREEEGWRLADEVSRRDGYNVVAHNLGILRERLDGFRSLDADGIVVRMDPREAAIYGEQALELLRQARRTLCAKYDVEPDLSVVVEVFPEQQDFAIRTFGLPGGAGFLGVCFGNVITAISPAAYREHPSSWRAVLWHEFCHAVTLRKTRNRMPRWLSEGISGYEERQADPAWGESLTPQFLEIITSGGLTPVSRLSGAFLDPPSPLHLQFAYYESALAVEYLVTKYGLEKLKRILKDLGDGTVIDEALERHTTSLENLDREFEVFALARSEVLTSRADWKRPELPEGAGVESVEAWVREHPKSFWGLQQLATDRISRERWEDAKEVLERIIELCPTLAGPGNPYEALAAVHRKLEDERAERDVLRRLREIDARAVRAYLRLLELSSEAGDWTCVASTAERLLAVNPLLEAPHRQLARAAVEIGEPRRAIPALGALLELDPVDPADLHFRLARLLREEGDGVGAKRHLLMALEEAPRFRSAHRELLEVVRELKAGSRADSSTGVAPKEKVE